MKFYKQQLLFETFLPEMHIFQRTRGYGGWNPPKKGSTKGGMWGNLQVILETIPNNFQS